MNSKLLRQAQQLQQQLEKVQQELESATVESTAGGGVVKAVISGKLSLVALTIDQEAIEPGDPEMLSEMIMVAINDGLSRAQNLAQTKMGEITGGLNIPGLQ